ncbi:MAG: EAL domain-containing protein [Clostridia bacterium]|nr:EAL domain-containing protein [Clostridia bacterium]
MSEQDWKRREYNTWDEAFRGLAPINRQQSVRVAEYTQILFTGALATSFGKNTPEGAARMHGKYADVAYKCGLYHQLGKALVPPEYQVWQKDFSEEEIAVYRKYTTGGRLLVATLQERGVRAKEKRTGANVETPTKNIPWLMMRESCEEHMERYNGTGYPAGKTGREISPIAQIVGLAKELDRLSAETKLEHPFDFAVETLISQSGTAWDPELIEILKNCEANCRAVYEKFIYYTMTLPETIPLVLKKEGRSMGLSYRPMAGCESDDVVAYEAVPWFGGIAGQPGETEGVGDVEEMLKRTGLVTDVSFYFLYEAADAVLRLENCKIESRGIILQMIPSFYKQGSHLQRFQKLFEDQPIPREKLMLTIPERLLIEPSKTFEELIARYLKNGICLILDDYHPGSIPESHLAELGFEYIRVAPELYLKQETANALKELRKSGFCPVGKDAADPDTLSWLKACGVVMISGPLTGHMTDEEGIIRDALVKMQ